MYNFKEAELGPSFAQDKLKEFKSLVEAGLSFVVISMPGVGVSYFLKYLAMQDFARSPSLHSGVSGRTRSPSLHSGVSGRTRFIHVDLYDLPTLSRHEFYRLLLTELGGKPFDSTQSRPANKPDEQLFLESKKILQTLAQKGERIVIIFSRFDQLKKEFDWNFLSNIQSLTTVSPGKITLIFTSVKPLHEIVKPEALSGGNLNFYSENLYFKPYSKEDLKRLLKIEPARPASRETLEKLLTLSGGHNQLFHILLSSQKEQLLLDRFVKMQLKEFVDYLNYHQRKQIQKIALGKKIEEVDEYLLGVGMVKNFKFELFTPLLTEYIKTNLPVKLPVKESKLFKCLRKNMGKVVSKDEIFAEVWEESEEATDWALDALIYRLRKHPFIQSNGYIIESHKKIGYILQAGS